jgi:ribonucleoside-diphosphate reductase alpha chain
MNQKVAAEIGVNPSAAITCVKPSGTVSQLVNAASGIHARHSEYYIRTVRGDKKDPLAQFMVEMGFPHEECFMKPEHQWVFSFPVKSPENAVFRNDMSAIEQLELWLDYQRYWCEHKPSVTVSVKEHEWFEVGSWVWNHFDEVSGVSFLPSSDHTYKQAPYQECGVEEYEELLAKIPQDVDWSGLERFEKEDNTKGAQTYSCTAGSCEIVDLT